MRLVIAALAGLVLLACPGCLFADMHTATPAQAEAPLELAGADGGPTLDEYVAELQKLADLRAENERLRRRIENTEARIEEEEASWKEATDAARERRARHAERFGLFGNFAMLAAAVVLATVASRLAPRRRERERGHRSNPR